MSDVIFWIIAFPFAYILTAFFFKKNIQDSKDEDKTETITTNDLAKFKKILSYLDACVVKLEGSDKFFLSENDSETGNKPLLFYRSGDKLLKTTMIIDNLEYKAGFNSISDMILFANKAYSDIIFRVMKAEKVNIDNYNDNKDLTKNSEEDLISQLVKASVNGEKDAEEEIFDKILELKKEI